MQTAQGETGAGAMPFPQVSIVIPNHNYARFLPGCFGSILAQRMNPQRLEVIFVDDASSDGSLELARELLPAMSFGWHEVIALPRQGRPGPVRNAGLARARGQALLTLDPDDELLPDFLPRCLAALAAGADVVYTDYLVEDEGTRIMRLGAYHKLLLANQNILSPTALFSRRLWDKGARFRGDTTYEDWDFWIQLALLRGRFAHVAQPLYRYRLHGGNYSIAARQADALSKAHIVLDNRAFYPSWTQAWAEGVLYGESGVDPLERGLIPILPEHAARRLAV
ncbi:MAG TPA: glycosyltransferase [Humidesulfovibrio sp.]|uniref:glycosyltransferase family 2 protein n=1 Tax=Humidesulfovibrio sp. TaxID=2910988 RepID=UPI002CC6368A|nr:glycosyltransferase [Humidesulfovibrio sp.]HWR05094.1 glycosyltransferase [Humidesulfovibrio sp.]